jgi:hypothetical protein
MTIRPAREKSLRVVGKSENRLILLGLLHQKKV